MGTAALSHFWLEGRDGGNLHQPLIWGLQPSLLVAKPQIEGGYCCFLSPPDGGEGHWQPLIALNLVLCNHQLQSPRSRAGTAADPPLRLEGRESGGTIPTKAGKLGVGGLEGQGRGVVQGGTVQIPEGALSFPAPHGYKLGWQGGNSIVHVSLEVVNIQYIKVGGTKVCCFGLNGGDC